MISKRQAICSALLVATLLLGAGPAFSFSAGQPTGLMITVTGTDPDALTADFDITMTTTSPYGIGSPVGFIGERYSYQYLYGGTFTVTNAFKIVYPSIPAIDFGDTSSPIDSTVLSLVAPGPPNVFAGSFMHTYPALGNYDVRAGVFRIIGAVSSVTPPTAAKGNLITIDSYSIFTRYFYALPTFTTPITQFLYSTVPFVLGISAGVDRTAGGGFAGLNLGAPAAVEVPTVGQGGLILLSVLLGLGGIYLLRRS